MKFCNNCVLPDTRPEIEIYNNGVCSACKNHNYRFIKNWTKRKKVFLDLVRKIKKKFK